jgi:hypothetical protein
MTQGKKQGPRSSRDAGGPCRPAWRFGSLFAALLCFTVVALLAEQRKPYTNDDVMGMVRAGLTQETILEAIRTNECHFDTSADALLTLKNAGVGERIIMAMLAAGRAPGGRSAPSGDSDALPAHAGIYVLKDGTYIPLEIESVQWRSRGWVSSTGSVKTTRLKADIATPGSSIQLSGSPEFLLVCPYGVAPAEYQLLRAEPEKKGREFRVEFRSLEEDLSGVPGGTPQTVVIIRGTGQKDVTLVGTRNNKVHFMATELVAGKFRLKPSELGKGEYAFLPPTKGLNGRLYTFGVR